VEEITIEIGAALGDELDRLVPKFKQVLNQFPESNRKLKYPSMSIFAVDTPITPVPRYEHEIGPLNEEDPDNKFSINKYVTGKLDGKLQLDLWAQSKEQRGEMVNLVQEAFESQETTSGLTITLKNYHDILSRFDLVGVSFPDSEESSQRKEWRAKLDVLVNCKTITAKKQSVIVTPELDLETPESIPEP